MQSMNMDELSKAQCALEGIRGKVRRAEDGLALLTDEMTRFCRELQESVQHEVREDRDEQVWVYRGETPNAPIEWSIRIGEILYNLRSALDHLAWQLVLANGQTPGPHTAFPIVDREPAWNSRRDRDLRGMSEPAIAQIRWLQPYGGGLNLPFDVSAFLHLHTLCNIDKHRHLILAAINLDLGRPIFNSGPPPVRGLEGSVYSGVISAGKLLCRCNKAEAAIRPSLRFCIGLNVDTDEPMPENWLNEDMRRILSVSPVIHILSECLAAVRGAMDLFFPRT